jgi:cobalamin 5'-phosphate synthase/cobalamin synthase
MKNTLKGFALAVSMLSIIPFFKVHDFFKGINGYAVASYPLVGFLLGLILWIFYSFLSPYFTHMHLAIIIFALWVVLTGALHLDGFSDTIDGLFVTKERALDVMKDPHTGGMGMIFSVTFLLLKASSLASLDDFYLLPVVLMLSRLNAVIAIYNYPYISKNGMSTLAKAEFNSSHFRITLLYTFVISLLFSSVYLFVFSLLTLWLVKNFFIKRYGGFTGDIYGFSIELTELVLLNVLIFGVL